MAIHEPLGIREVVRGFAARLSSTVFLFPVPVLFLELEPAPGCWLAPDKVFSFRFSVFHLRRRVLRSFSEGGGYGGQVGFQFAILSAMLELTALPAMSALLALTAVPALR